MKSVNIHMAEERTAARSVVLVVQEEPLLTLAMIDFVEAADCEAVVVLSAAEAVRVLEARTDIRIVFADIDMRGSLMGMRLAAMVRDRWPPIELLLLSTQPKQATTLPVRAVLVGKPFEDDKVVAAIRSFAVSI